MYSYKEPPLTQAGMSPGFEQGSSHTQFLSKHDSQAPYLVETVFNYFKKKKGNLSVISLTTGLGHHCFSDRYNFRANLYHIFVNLLFKRMNNSSTFLFKTKKPDLQFFFFRFFIAEVHFIKHMAV
jgi:hypothetical protein